MSSVVTLHDTAVASFRSLLELQGWRTRDATFCFGMSVCHLQPIFILGFRNVSAGSASSRRMWHSQLHSSVMLVTGRLGYEAGCFVVTLVGVSFREVYVSPITWDSRYF